MQAAVTDLLRRVPLFRDLADEDLTEIAEVAVPRHYEAGTRVFGEGDHGDTCFVISRGRVRVTRKHRDGRTITLATLGPGDFFGELAMFDSETRSASVEAAEDLDALALVSGDFKRLLARRPEVAVKLVNVLGQRLREANERISMQSFQSVPGRVALVLAGLAAERGRPGEGEVTVHATQSEIAQLAGTSRESVSRFLATLQRAGVVEVARGRVRIVDPAALRRYVW